jgi:hypothetical protein
LNISAGLNSVITIYILVPFLLIPQIIFCGVLVKYDKLHKSLTNYEYVPVIGDLMASRWAFEALAVNQFKDNKYQKVYFDVDKKISDANYYKAYLVPQIDIRLGTVERKLKAGTDLESLSPNLELIHRELVKLGWQVPQVPAFDASTVHAVSYNDSTPIAIRRYLDQITEYNRLVLNETRAEKDRINKALIDRLGGLEAYTRFRNNYDNDQLSDMLLNRSILQKVDEKDGKLIRKHEPAYMTPTSPFVRAQLYAPVKRLGNLEIDTVWFNIIFLWLYSALLYLVLYYDLLRKLLVYLETLRLIPRRRST